MDPHLSAGYIAEAWHAHILVLGLLSLLLLLPDKDISEVFLRD
jgi:hypothetical protein